MFRYLSLLLLLAAVPVFAAEWVVIPVGERQVHAYLARPQSGEGKVVVLIHEIFGLSDWVISVADRLAHDQAWARWLDLLAQLASSLPSAVEESTWGQAKTH